MFYIFAALSWLSRPSHTPLVTALLVCHHTYKHREETVLDSRDCAQTPQQPGEEGKPMGGEEETLVAGRG